MTTLSQQSTTITVEDSVPNQLWSPDLSAPGRDEKCGPGDLVTYKRTHLGTTNGDADLLILR